MNEDAKYLQEILPKLAEPMPYKWRVQSFSQHKPEATCVAYVDARDVQDRLDEVCTYGYDRDHKELKGSIYAGIGIWMPSGRIQWRWDCGADSNIEAEKGGSSDSFKRAAVNWGIGRFLYHLKVKTLRTNEKKGASKYSPKIIDSKGNWVEDLTEYINSLGDIEPPDPTYQLVLTFLDGVRTIDSMEDFVKKNQKEIKISPRYEDIRSLLSQHKQKLLNLPSDRHGMSDKGNTRL